MSFTKKYSEPAQNFKMTGKRRPTYLQSPMQLRSKILVLVNSGVPFCLDVIYARNSSQRLHWIIVGSRPILQWPFFDGETENLQVMAEV